MVKDESMNKKDIAGIIEKQKKETRKLTKTITKSGYLSEKDTIVSRKQHGEYRYYVQKEGKGEQQYLGEDKEKEITRLCTSTYAARLVDAAEKEIEQLDKCLKILNSKANAAGIDKADIDAVYGNLPEGIRQKIKPSVVTDDGFAEKWQNEKYKNRWKGNADYTIETPRGEKVRSKSEWIIACMLAEAEVPYRYEECVGLNKLLGMVFYPDFTVLNKRTREVFFWEHFGKMDDPKYINESYMPKMLEYYNFGFLPGKKLLMTFESKRYPLDTTQVKRLIEEFLL